jgi:hypothetical protein
VNQSSESAAELTAQLHRFSFSRADSAASLLKLLKKKWSNFCEIVIF